MNNFRYALVIVLVFNVLYALRPLNKQNGAAAYNGFDPQENYPDRNHTYDGYLAPRAGVSDWQIDRLVFDFAMPQSHGAMVSILGYPTAEHGNFAYWKLANSSSELAVYYVGDKAYWYTFGQ